jgi:hypothetical protein
MQAEPPYRARIADECSVLTNKGGTLAGLDPEPARRPHRAAKADFRPAGGIPLPEPGPDSASRLVQAERAHWVTFLVTERSAWFVQCHDGSHFEFAERRSRNPLLLGRQSRTRNPVTCPGMRRRSSSRRSLIPTSCCYRKLLARTQPASDMRRGRIPY